MSDSIWDFVNVAGTLIPIAMSFLLLAFHIYQEMSVILYIGVLIRLRLLFDDILPSEGRQLSGLLDWMQSIIRFVLTEIERFWNYNVA
jgi:hypothetical protein